MPNRPVFQSLATAHYGGAFYAVFRENSTDLPETCTKCHLWCKNGDAALGSLLFIRFQKKVQRDRCRQSKKKAHVARMSEVNAAGRVFRVQGSSFQEKMSLGSPKKRNALKKRLFIAIKKKGTRAPCNCLARMSEVNAAGRVFRVQGSSFQEKMSLGSPKKRTALKKRLFIAIKKRNARAMQLLNAQLRRAAHRACVQFKYIYSVACITRHHYR